MERGLFVNNDEAHLGEFTCAICLCVPDPNSACFSTAVCQHVFCLQCFEEWMQRGAAKCPTCNRECAAGATPPLVKNTSALAARLLNRLQVKCSLSSCTWIGDYANLDAHLTNSDTHIKLGKTTPATAASGDDAEQLKELGNERYAAGKFQEAIKLYNKALLAQPANPGLIQANKAAAYLKMDQYRLAAESCESAIKQGNLEPKVYFRWAQSLLSMFDFVGAKAVLDQFTGRPDAKLEQLKASIDTWSRAWQDGVEQVAKGDYANAQANMSRLLQCPYIAQQTPVLARAAIVEAHVGNTDFALKLSLQCCRESPNYELAWVARAYALCSTGELGEALECSKQSMRLHPDNDQCKACFRFVRTVSQKVTSARQLAAQAKYDEACEALQDLVHGTLLPKSSPLRIQLLAERGHTLFSAHKYEEALRDCDAAIAQKPDSQRAWLTKFYCLRNLKKFQEAVDYARELMQTWGASDPQIRNCCEKAEFDLRKHNRPDLYQVLGGISTLSSEMEIKQAYKKWALALHPDKATDEEDRKKKEEQFKLLGIALEILGNAESRELYDQGYDVQGIKDELERRKRRSGHYHH